MLFEDQKNPCWVFEELRKRGDFTSNLRVVRKVKNDREVGIASIALLKACAKKKDLHKGISLHGDMLKTGLLGRNRYVRSTLISMYAKCGALIRAREVLFEIPNRDVVSWNALIAGYAQQGEGEKTLECLKEMEHEGIAPNTVTFRSLLQACSYSGLVDEGQMLFTIMSRIYGIIPDLEHHACLVDLFGRAGLLEEAERFVYKMPYRAHDEIWMTLFSASKLHKDTSLAERAACGTLCNL